MSLDRFFNRTYSAQTYNCAHFVCEVWKETQGQDISGPLSGFLRPAKLRKVRASIRHQFERLDGPRSPCIVLMQRPGYAPHVGMFIRGRVFHIQRSGVQFQPIDVAAIGFTQVRFYNVKNNRPGAQSA